MTADGEFANLIRVWIAPAALQAALSFEAAREFAFRTVSQINVNYRASPLSQGGAGHVHAGRSHAWGSSMELTITTLSRRWSGRRRSMASRF